MQTVPRFSEMPYRRPSPEDIKTAATTLIEAWEAASGVTEQTQVLKDWDAFMTEYNTNNMLARVHFQQQTDDPSAKEEQAFFDDLNPILLENNVEFLRKVTSAPNRSSLEDQLGAHAFKLWDCFLGTFAPEIADGNRQEAKLKTEYSELLAGLKIDFNGETYNLSTIRGLFGHKDRDIRHGAQKAKSNAMAALAPELDRIYDELVHVRHDMATRLGYRSFTPMGYRQMSRTDYTDTDVAEFRKQIREVVVPLANKIYARRATALGIQDFSFHDESVRDPSGVP